MARILVIDDNPDMLKMLQMILEKRGQHQVTVCTNGREGLDLAFELQPDVTVIDVMMPGLSGYEVVRELRKDPRTKETRILILTARGQPVDREAAFSAGADEHMSKPVNVDELLETIEALLEMVREPEPKPQGQPQAEKAPSPPTQAAILPIFSLKGGVGVTTLAVNLAGILQQVAPTLLIDLSPNSGHCTLFLGLRPQKHWGKYLEDTSKPLSSLLMEHASGLRLLAAPPIPLQSGWFNDPDLDALLNQATQLARFIVVDMPPVLNPAAQLVLNRAYRIVVVTGDDAPALQTTMTTLQALQSWKERVMLVRNAVAPIPHPPVDAIQRAMRAPLSADVPFDQAQLSALRKGTPLAIAQPQAPLIDGLKRAAQIILTR